MGRGAPRGRNPLSGITMQSEFLLQNAPEGDHRGRRAAEGVRRAATRMNRLIQDLLDVTRIEAGHLSVEASRQPTAALVAETIEGQRPFTSASSAELRLDLAPGLPDVMADRDRLVRVFENLIGNAIKFTGSGGHIVVGAEARGADVLFWVADDGPGIPADAVPHLFRAAQPLVG